MSCAHTWIPTPADAASAMELVGITRCVGCRKVATAEDMAAFGKQLKRDHTFGEVMHDYDAFAPPAAAAPPHAGAAKAAAFHAKGRRQSG
jgi:hypothetical protein